MTLIRFTSNHDDLSTERGYQFKFYCDKCHNGYMTKYQASVTGTAGSVLRAAGDLFGGIFSSAGNSAYEIQRAVGGKAHDSAFEAAVEEGKGYFHQCTRCGIWACPEVCWNAAAGMCENCAPDFESEMASAQAHAKAEAARSQLYEKASKVDYTSNVDMSATSQVQAKSACASCGAAVGSAKFCPECGTPTATKQQCPGCNITVDGKPKFCPDCGTKLPGWK